MLSPKRHPATQVRGDAKLRVKHRDRKTAVSTVHTRRTRTTRGGGLAAREQRCAAAARGSNSGEHSPRRWHISPCPLSACCRAPKAPPRVAPRLALQAGRCGRQGACVVAKIMAQPLAYLVLVRHLRRALGVGARTKELVPSVPKEIHDNKNAGLHTHCCPDLDRPDHIILHVSRSTRRSCEQPYLSLSASNRGTKMVRAAASPVCSTDSPPKRTGGLPGGWWAVPLRAQPARRAGCPAQHVD